ncbi:hypothetical protein Hte_000457 [Hypoxylon texense]
MSTIAGLVASCVELFKFITIGIIPDGSNQLTTSKLADEFMRFKIWSANIGAHRTGRSSLDYRLRDASHLKKHVNSLLIDLIESLKNALAILRGERIPWDEFPLEDIDSDQDSNGPPDDCVEFETELAQISTDVTETVDCLLRLSVSIRNPAPHDRLKGSTRIDVSHYEEFDISHIATKFRPANPKLAEHLGKANSRRRQFFRYRAFHHDILSDGLDTDTSKPALEGKSTVASSIPQFLKDETSHEIEDIDEDEVSESGITQSSFATIRDNSSKPSIPALPVEASKGPFECPFCYTMISVSSRRAWKKHIFADLRPYNCLALDCPVLGSDFARRHQWMDHMLQKHWRLWHCPFCYHPPFSSSECLHGHLRDSHLDTANEDQLRASAELSTSEHFRNSVSNCPLCQEPLSSAKDYKRHVGRHLEDIALFVLPRVFGDDASDAALDEGSQENDNDHSISASAGSIKRGEDTAVMLEDPDTSSHTLASLSLPQTLGYEFNDYRAARTTELLDDLKTLQYYIAAAPVDPPNTDDYYTEGWSALRQCSVDGQYILNVAQDSTVPYAAGSEAHQAMAELKQVLLDAFARRHQAQKIYLRQTAAQRWIEYRDAVLQGGRPNSSNREQLRACDEQFRSELSEITDEAIYLELRTSDTNMGRWVTEDPSLSAVLRWLRTRPQTT